MNRPVPLAIALALVFLVAACNQDSNSIADVDSPIDDYPSAPAENGYHWDGAADPYYEGWYFKVSDPATGFSFFFIYGVIFPGDPENGIAFVHFGGGPNGDVFYVPVPLERFSASSQNLNVTVGSTTARAERIEGVLWHRDFTGSWDLSITPGAGWDKTMGALTGVDGIDVNWDVIHLRATASGTIDWNGTVYEIEDAVCYADHNWGPAFPEYWMWMQGNHFAGTDDAIAIAGGVVSSFVGRGEAYMVGYLRDGVFYTYRTQDADFLTGSYKDGVWQVFANDDDTRVAVWGTADPWTMLALYGPTEAGMQPVLGESVVGQIGVSQFVNVDGEWIDAGERVTDLAGVEVGGVWP